jgi:hypothetical protein
MPRQGNIGLTIAVLKYAGTILVLSTSVMMMMSSHGNGADLRLRMPSAASRQEQPHKGMKALFEEFLRWKSQQPR